MTSQWDSNSSTATITIFAIVSLARQKQAASSHYSSIITIIITLNASNNYHLLNFVLFLSSSSKQLPKGRCAICSQQACNKKFVSNEVRLRLTSYYYLIFIL